jgi:hypothetical protein
MEITNGKVHDKSAEFAHKNPENKKIRHRALSHDKKVQDSGRFKIKHLFTPFNIFIRFLVYK